MLKISVSGDGVNSFVPGDNVKLSLQTQILDEILTSKFIDFNIPKDPKNIQKVEVTLSSDDIKIPVTTLGATSVTVTQYKSEGIENQPHLRKVTLLCATGTNMTNFKINDRIAITATGGSQLSALNGGTYIIQQVLVKTRRIVINPTFSGNQLVFASLTGTNSFVKSTTTQHNGKRYVVTVDNEYIKEFLYNDAFRDIIIFAYSEKESLGELPGSKILLVNSPNVQIAEDRDLPPNYSDVAGYEKKSVYRVDLLNKPNTYYIFYVAVARYQYVNGSWTPYSWVHKDTANKTMWKLARRAA